MLTAAARALHRAGASPWILDDAFAAGLAGDEGAEAANRVTSRLPPEGLTSFVVWVCLRGRFSEDFVDRAIGDGIGQYVILGAGLDSSAYRHASWLEHATVFEVDHEASQAWKRSRLRELGIDEPANLVFAPVDFERETLRDGLVRSGFDVTAPAVFSWMGVSMYLTSQAITATLHEVASFAPGSRLVMTYNRRPERVDAFSREVTSTIASVVGGTGEPFLSLFEPDEAQALLRTHGLLDVEDIGPDDLKARYLDGAAGVRLAQAQRILTASVR